MIKEMFNYIDSPTQFVEVNGTLYAYRSIGRSSDYPLVCLQHFTGTLDNWDPIIINGLAKERQVITIDNSGIGSSGGTTPDNIQDMTLDAIRVITAIGINKCDVLGYSLGGCVAQKMGVMRPDLVRKMILVGTCPQGTEALVSFPQLIERAFQLPKLERFLFLFASKTGKSRTKLTAALQRLMERKQDRDKETTLPSIQAQIKALTRWGADASAADLEKFDKPVMIIQGSDDEMMDSDSSWKLYRQIPNSVLTYYPDSGHGSYTISN